MFAVDRDLLQLLRKAPDLDARAAELERQYDSERLGIVAVGAAVYEAMPEVAQILRKHRISGRDYLLTKIAAMIAEMSADASVNAVLALQAPQREGASDGFLGPAVKFWREMDPALKAEAARWTAVRDELAKLGRHKVW